MDRRGSVSFLAITFGITYAIEGVPILTGWAHGAFNGQASGIWRILFPGVNPRLGSIPILGTGWIRWSIVLFSISGLAFMFCLAPLHARLADLALLLMILKPSLPAL